VGDTVIGRLSGTLIRKEPPVLVVDVGGVGYECEAPMTTFYDLPPLGQQVVLYTHLVVREDALALYGFAREAQRRLFRELLKVSGVGPRVALAVLSGLSDEEFARCVREQDTARLSQVPGIGRKTAERLIVEMRDKLPALPADAEAAAAGAPATRSEGAPIAGGGDPVREAVSALIALGYKPNEASQMVRRVRTEGLATEQIIRLALKGVAR
jgi:Holliday junction DNA helicase RuvA